MDLATGAMGSLLPKLAELLSEEYKLQKGVREGVKSLEKEMRSMHAALRVVGEVPRDQQDELVKLWAGEVRELSFDMEDVVDKFLVRVDNDSEPARKSNKLKQLMEKMAGLFTKGKARHEIADAIKEINKKVQDVADRRQRYNVDNIMPAAVTSIDPRLKAMYTEVTELVGISGKRDQELMLLLSNGDSMSKNKLKIISVVGFGGLGKTTLVKTVYDKIKGDFTYRAFVPVGRTADAKKVFMDILVDLGMYGSELTGLDERQLIDKLRERLENQRYLIVIDDIWDEKLWKIINLAFSRNNNVGSRLITTTRIVSVSKLCCSSTSDSVYQMRPLSDDESKSLFYKRIFSQEIGCPHEFEEVSIDILKKCGGVPLAIITVASILASDQHVKHVDEWYALLESIGRGLTDDPSVEEMLRILSFSYYDLPSHLKTCLLYLSMFPEDSEIMKHRLIWMWIAENFVKCEKGETSLFEVGESYFNELVNRSMIQLVYNDYEEREACRVHDMVLDLICSLSSQENFVTISNGTGDGISTQNNIRRLSLQNISLQDTRKEEHHVGLPPPPPPLSDYMSEGAPPIPFVLEQPLSQSSRTTTLESDGMLQVRSIVAFAPAIGALPSFSSFVVLRVLDLTGCDLSDHNHLNLLDLASLFHLRYLGLYETGITYLPADIGKLRFLQVLDVGRNHRLRELPSSVIQLRRLMCLLLHHQCTGLPHGLGNLTAIEMLYQIRGDSLSTVKGLSNMGKLRQLRIQFEILSLEVEEAFVESLDKLSKIQSLEISIFRDHPMHLLAERWVPPRSIQEFVTEGFVRFSTLPTWIRRNPSHLLHLSKFSIRVNELRQEDLDILGRLPGLHSLTLSVFRQSGLLLVRAHGFHCLTSLALLPVLAGKIMFLPGALAKAEQVELKISLQVEKGEAAGNSADFFDLGMAYLTSLRNVCVTLDRTGVTLEEARQAYAALENVLLAHPNRPTFEIDIYPPPWR